MRHKHADLIHAWAEGAEIEYFSDMHRGWVRVVDGNPLWSADTEYRIKPEKKPDKCCYIRFSKFGERCSWIQGVSSDESAGEVKFTFSGDTGKLIKAEVL